MENPDVKKIYKHYEALVSDKLINSSDAEIDAAIYDVKPGMIIYNAGRSIVKQRSLDGHWVRMSTGGGGGGTSSGGTIEGTDIDIASDDEVNGMLDDVFNS